MNRLTVQLYRFLGLISEEIWGRLSSSIQLASSAVIAKLYHTRVSAFFIRPYCRWQYRDVDYPKRYVPGNGKHRYETFQDFFTRNLPKSPDFNSPEVWPCEGYLCEMDKVENISTVKVKGEKRHVRTIFGKGGHKISDESYFSNVFLHNKNYHHIHSPVDGQITRIEHIPGQLLLLRPWVYKGRPSLPALTNERVNVDIKDESGKEWMLSIVGGPLVATINLIEDLVVGREVKLGQKLASFALGSTCCMISPNKPNSLVGDSISMGDCLHPNQKQ